VKIVVLSDTHIPRTAADIPNELYKSIESADLVLHAGDFVEMELLDKLRGLKKLVAVYGNMDSSKVKEALAMKEVISVGKFRIGLTHGYGAPNELKEAVRSEFGKVDAIVFGHSHTPVNLVEKGVLFFNPGSPTDKIFAPYNSYGILEVNERIEGKIVKIET
jgi:putative phosphoesterase